MADSAGRRVVTLDPVGGIAGDMFVAAMLDAEPHHAAACLQAAEVVSGVACRLLRHQDGALAGARFWVAEPPDGEHAHTAWAVIRTRLHEAALPPAVRGHALGIFAALAEAEAQVHGIAPDAVTFHEVGAADSIADIAAAAWLIAAQETQAGAARWSVGPLPLGGGQVCTAHGLLPVPAPATALLLRGFAVQDDGIGGERVTPTGAAILRHLGAQAAPPPGPRTLRATGLGFGTRRLPGLPNLLRVLIGESAADVPEQDRRSLSVICFEVDDQTPEDLAIALGFLRAVPGVVDVVQMAAFGKKGRMAAHVQILAAPESAEAAIDAAFRETTTLGLRVQMAEGRMLRRAMDSAAVDGQALRVKRAARPGGATAKTESDDVAATQGHAARQRLRFAAEQGAALPAARD